MAREIGNLKWVTLEEADGFLRPENIEKKAILSQLTSLLNIFSPVIKADIHGKLLNENKSEEQQRQYVYRIKSGTVQGPMDRSRRFFGAR
jgi:hypothetical protein